MFCPNCGKEIPENSAFCLSCGTAIQEINQSGLLCPRCGSSNVAVQLIQENQGTTSVSKTKAKTKVRVKEDEEHGCLWWIFIGWWWKLLYFTGWLLFCIPVGIYKLIRSASAGKAKTKATTVSQTKNHITYKNVCICNNCGLDWINE